MAKYINSFKETVSKQLNWQHFDLNNADLVNLLEVNVVELDNITRTILCADETRPRILQLKAGYILILRAINLNLNATPEDMVSIRFFVTENNIYSFSKRRLKAIDDMRELLKQKNELNNSEEFVLLFVNCLLNSLTPFMQDLAEQIEQIEDKIIAERIADNRQKILTLRKQIFTIKRYLRPQNEVLNLLKKDYFQSIKNKKHLAQNIDHHLRFIEDFELYLAKLNLLKDELSNIVTDKLTRNSYIIPNPIFKPIFILQF